MPYVRSINVALQSLMLTVSHIQDMEAPHILTSLERVELSGRSIGV